MLVPIVEGHGERQAIPLLLRRIGTTVDAQKYIDINPPIRVKAGSFLNDSEYCRRYLELATAKARHAAGVVLIVLDCEDDCAAQVGPRLVEQARAVSSDVSTLVCLAVREYETWLLAAAESLSGHCGLPENLAPPADVEGIRDAKGWLSQRMPTRYDPIAHQATLTDAFDLDVAQRQSPSFARAFTRIRHVITHLNTAPQQ